MEELIKQAFLHVDVIGPHVQEGHYDLIGPNGEIILPTVWEKVVEPDWSITMHMWPMDKTPLRSQMHPGMMPPGGVPRPQHHPGHPPQAQRPHGHGGGIGAAFARPPSRAAGGGGIPPPPPPPGANWPGMQGRMRPGVEPVVLTAEPVKQGKSGRRDKAPTGVLGWMAGTKPAKSGKKYVFRL